MNVKVTRLSLLTAAVLLMGAGQVNATTYNFSILNSLGGNWSAANGINNAGQVVGASKTAAGDYHATLWNGTTATDLGTLGGTRSEAFGINDFGQVVGYSYTAGNAASHAFLYSNGSMSDLGALVGPSGASAINNSGQVVGWGGSAAAVWNGGVATPLPSPAGFAGSNTQSINDSGQIVGTSRSSRSGYTTIATLWTGSGVTTLAPLPGFSSSYARAINNSGQIAGTSINYGAGFPGDIFMGTLWSGTSATTLTPLAPFTESEFWAINDSGWVVGSSFNNILSDFLPQATLWKDGVAINLNSLLSPSASEMGLNLYQATSVNNNGWIVAHAGGGLQVLLTPVPEPETYALFLAGLGLMGAVARRRKIKQGEANRY